MKRYIKADIVTLDEEHEESQRMLAKDPNTNLRTLDKLSYSEFPFVRALVASNPNTSEAILVRLAEDEDSLVRLDVGVNPNTPLPTLLRLYNDKNMWLHSHINEGLNQLINATEDPEVISKVFSLAYPKNEYLLTSIGRNVHTPVDILIALTKHKDEWVFAEALCNPRIPEDILRKAAKSKIVKKRKWAANNISTPIDVLTKLLQDPDFDVRYAAKDTLARVGGNT